MSGVARLEVGQHLAQEVDVVGQLLLKVARIGGQELDRQGAVLAGRQGGGEDGSGSPEPCCGRSHRIQRSVALRVAPIVLQMEITGARGERAMSSACRDGGRRQEVQHLVAQRHVGTLDRMQQSLDARRKVGEGPELAFDYDGDPAGAAASQARRTSSRTGARSVGSSSIGSAHMRSNLVSSAAAISASRRAWARAVRPRRPR